MKKTKELNDKILENMCQNTYTDDISQKKAEGFYYYDTYEKPKTGFYADIYISNNNKDKVVIAFKGSNDIKDLLQDLKMWKFEKMPEQFRDARKLYDSLVSLSDLEDAEFIFTGHSLGGSVAAYLGCRTGCRTVTFNPFGIGKMVSNPQNTTNVTNYGNPKDRIFMEEINNQVGKVKYVFNLDNFKSEKLPAIKKYHQLESMGNIDFATEDISGQQFVQKIYNYVQNNKNKMTFDEILNNLPYLEGSNSNSCPGYVTVDEYQRNGHKVSGYVRSCPYHN